MKCALFREEMRRHNGIKLVHVQCTTASASDIAVPLKLLMEYVERMPTHPALPQQNNIYIYSIYIIHIGVANWAEGAKRGEVALHLQSYHAVPLRQISKVSTSRSPNHL
jgi:hypothetical protein